MTKDRLEGTYDGVEPKSLDTLYRPNHEDSSQKRLQNSARADPVLSPWSLIANPNEPLHPGSLEICTSKSLESTFDEDCVPSVAIENDEFDRDFSSEPLTWKDGIEEEEQDVGCDTAQGSASPTTHPMNLNCFQGDLRPNAFQTIQMSPDTCAQSCRATEKRTEPFGQIGAQSSLGDTVGFHISTHSQHFQPPSIFISNNDIDDIADENQHNSSGSYDSALFQTETKRIVAQYSNKPVTPIQRNIRPKGFDRYLPNNYEVATHEREPPDVSGSIDPECEKLAADSVQAFCEDADSTAADVAANHATDANLLHVKRRRPSRCNTMLQTPTNDQPSLQNWHNPSCNPPTPSAFHKRLQTPTYLSPPLSFRNLPQNQHLDSAHGRDDPPSTQATPSRISSLEPPSPISPSPSNLSEAADDLIRCPSCSYTVFDGKRGNGKNSLQRHNRDYHRGMPRLQCLVENCAVTFAPGRKDNRIRHVRAMHPDFPLPAPSRKRKRTASSDLESY